MPPVIKVENLSKMYRLGEVGTGTVRDDLARAWAKLRGKEDPFQKVGQVNRRDEAADGDHEYVWALQDINFEVEQGEILGIIGRNGAGKSTLLKLLSRITSPTTGRIRARGRIASLLEVGTGFHPELSGRDNIYLNGALLGMTRREVTNRLEEIVEFSGCAKYIDTPVKRYSSGMMVRLGFSVAAHLECEILIVDEVLAVGDAEFQKRCLGKMSDVANDGRTILFVSHNMAAVTNLCPKSIMLASGNLASIDATSTIVQKYQDAVTITSTDSLWNRNDRSGRGRFRVVDLRIHSKGYPIGQIVPGQPMNIVLRYHGAESIACPRVILGVYDRMQTPVLRFDTYVCGFDHGHWTSQAQLTVETEEIALPPGTYSVNVALLSGNDMEDYVAGASTFIVTEDDFWGTGRHFDQYLCRVLVRHKWHIEECRSASVEHS